MYDSPQRRMREHVHEKVASAQNYVPVHWKGVRYFNEIHQASFAQGCSQQVTPHMLHCLQSLLRSGVLLQLSDDVQALRNQVNDRGNTPKKHAHEGLLAKFLQSRHFVAWKAASMRTHARGKPVNFYEGRRYQGQFQA